MSTRVVRLLAPALLALALARPSAAQPSSRLATERPAADSSWLARVGFVVRGGGMRLTGHGELQTLLDEALTPGARALRPRLIGLGVTVRVDDRWAIVAGTDGGGSSVASASRVTPSTAVDVPRQWTSLDLRAMPYVGAEWRAWSWHAAGATAADRATVVLGAGGGVASYRLHQWGAFVDVDRDIVFADDFRSAGRGVFGYVALGAEVPVTTQAALRLDLRRHAGTARMNRDYTEFDRVDLAGTGLSLGVVLRPAAERARR